MTILTPADIDSIVNQYSDDLLNALEPPPINGPVHVPATEWLPIDWQYADSGEWEPDTNFAPFDGRRYLLRTEMGAIVGRWVKDEGITHEGREYDGRQWLLLDDQIAFDPEGVFGWRDYVPAEWGYQEKNDEAQRRI